MRAVAHPRRLAGLALLGTAAALWAAQPAQAQGFSVFEHGSCAMARAGAGAAAPCNDGSAIFFSPAAVAGTRGLTASIGATVVAASGEWRPNTGSATELDNDPITVPHAYLTYGITDKLGVGLGLYVPYGLGTTWPTAGFEGRFLGYDNSLNSIYIQPTAAYQLTDQLSVGAGVTYVTAKIELNQRLDVSEQKSGTLPLTAVGAPRGTDFADGHLKGDGTGLGGHIGILFKASDRLSLAARYLTKVTIDYEGDATFAPITFDPRTWTLPAGNPLGAPAGTPVSAINLPAGNPFGVPAGTPLAAVISGGVNAAFSTVLADQTVQATLVMPAQLIAGVGFQASPKLLLLADYQFTQWSSFEKIEVEFEKLGTNTRFENYKDTHCFRVGGDYAFSEAFTLRAGGLVHGAAAPDQSVTPLLPEANRKEVTIGAGLHLTKAIELNAAYQYLQQDDREGRVREPAAGVQPTAALNSGTYSFSGQLFGATLTFHF